MGAHRTNPVALANAVPRDRVAALDLGENAALIGVQLMPVLDEKRENFIVFLCGIGGRRSDLVPLEPRPVVLAELFRAPVGDVRKAFLGGLASTAPEATEVMNPGGTGEVVDAAAPGDSVKPLVVLP